MGILAEPLQFIRDLDLPRGFSVLELGDQFLTAGQERQLARDWYKALGCGRYTSIDGNGRNGAMAHDLNKVFNAQLAYDLVTDFGTGEHIFDQAEVWRTLHGAVKPMGHIVFDRPTAGYEGHCFYLIQWNLISAIAHANSYTVLRLEEHASTRGVLLRGVLQAPLHKKGFVVPQQGRYVKDLVVDPIARGIGPDHKSENLRRAGVVGRQR